MKYERGDQVEVTSEANPSEWLPAEIEGPANTPDLIWVRIFFADGAVGRGVRFIATDIRPHQEPANATQR